MYNLTATWNPNTTTFTSNGGEISLSLALDNYDYYFQSVECSASVGTGEGFLNNDLAECLFMIPANTGDAREITLSATVIIGTLTDEAYTETITKTYTQEAGTNELTITWNQEVMNVYYIDGVSSNGFTKTGDFSSYSVYLKPDWVTYVSKAQSEDKFYVYYSTNQNAYQRSGTITIDFVDAVSGDTVRTSFMIVQAAGTGEVRITANPTSMQLGEGAYSNRTVTFTSTSSDTMEIAINTYPSWILNPTVSYGDKTATITFGVAANDTGASRSHSIICRQGSVSATCAINQGAIEQINVSFNQSNISVGSSATSSRCGFTVYSGTVNSTSFTAPSWITNLRVSNNEILFDVAANTETTERVGTVSVLFNNELTKGFTVTQAARELQPITVSFSQLTINALQASNRYENSYSINTGTLSRVETIDCPTWITIISTTNKIVFETSNNDNTTERSTTLKFRFYGLDDSYDAVFDVIQAPKVITNLNIAFNNQTVSCSNAAGNYSNTFTIVGTSNNVGQITKPEWVDNVSVDFNSRTVSFSVLANTSNSERTGNINIQFYDVENDTYPLFGFAVSQAGKTTVNLNIQFANQTINSTYTGGNFNNQFTVTGNYSNIGQITNPSWITNVSVSNNTVSFSVSSNSGNSRSGNISIPFYDTDNQKYVSFGFNVNQSGVSITDLDIAFDNQTVSVSKSGGVTNVGFTVTGTTNSYGTIQKPSWIKGVKVNFNTNKVVFSVEENTSPNNREGTVTIPFYDNQNSRYVSFGFNVNQQGDINVVFTPTSVASSGGTITATVNSIYTVTNWEIIQKPSYVTVNYNGNTATLIIGANNSTVRRDINLYWRVTAGGSNYSGYSTIKQYGITNNMAYPVYKDYVITDQVYSGFVEYHIESDSELVYAGKVYPKPNSSSVTWKLNEICSDYLGNDIIFTNGVHQIPGYLKEFYLESTGSNSGSYNFYNAWDEVPSSKLLSNPIDNIVDNRQWLPISWLSLNGEYLIVDGNVKYPTTNLSANTYMMKLSDYIRSCNSIIDVSTSVGGNIKYKIGSGDYVLYYSNVYGGWDSILLKGKKTDEIESFSYYNNRKIKFLNKITSTWELYTNFGVSGDKMYNLIESTNVYLHNLDKNTITPVVIRNTEVEYSNGRKPYRYVINVEESKVKFRK